MYKGDSSLIQESLISILYIIICSDMEKNGHPKEVALLGCVALLARLRPYWRECVTVEAGFEVSYAQVTFSVSVHFLLAWDQYARTLSNSTMSACMLPCFPS